MITNVIISLNLRNLGSNGKRKVLKNGKII
jgi:hypothetical protein